MTSSAASQFAMPPEWVRHERTWMEFPPANTTFGDDPDGELGEYRRVWADVTNAIARFEPVTLICDVGDGEVARALVDPAVSIVEAPIDECWFRDSGPTFVTRSGGAARRGACGGSTVGANRSSACGTTNSTWVPSPPISPVPCPSTRRWSTKAVASTSTVMARS